MELGRDILQGLFASLLTSLPQVPAALGFYIALRCLRFPDLTVEGSFVFGQAISAIAITAGWNAWVGISLAVCGGIALGGITGFQHKVWKIPAFVCGIVTTFFITTFNYKLLRAADEMYRASSGAVAANEQAPATLNLPNSGIFLNAVNADLASINMWGELRLNLILQLLVIVLVCASLIYLILRSRLGLRLRAFGVHRQTGEIYEAKASLSIILGLCLTNSLVAFGGSIYAQSTTLASIEMGTTLLIPLLAAVVIGEFIVDWLMPRIYNFVRRMRNKDARRRPLLSMPFKLTLAPILGFVTYNLVFLLISTVLLPKSQAISSYWKFVITALIIVLILIVRKQDKFIRIHPEDVI